MHEEIFRLPTCGWPEDPEEKWIGTWMEEMLNGGIDGILRAYQLRVAGLTMEQHQVCSAFPGSVPGCLIFGYGGVIYTVTLWKGLHLTESHTTGSSHSSSERPKKSGLSHLFEFPRRLWAKAGHGHIPRAREDTRNHTARRTIIIISKPLGLTWTTRAAGDRANAPLPPPEKKKRAFCATGRTVNIWFS